MAMDLRHHHHQQQQHHENLWLSVAHLPAASSFPCAPWEQRHRQEVVLRDGLDSTYKPHSSNRHHQNNKDNNNNNELNVQHLHSDLPQAQEPAFQLTSVREAELVSRCLYALQGIPVVVTGLQCLAKLFSGQVADRSLHRLPSLWQRSSSTKALGKLLTVIAQAGWVRCQLEEFVLFFLKPQKQGMLIDQLYTDSEMQPQLVDSRQRKRGRRKTKHRQKVTTAKEEELNLSPPYSLVNQAFAKAVKTILQGHLAALNALTGSVLHRRSTDGSQTFDPACLDEHVGAVIGLPSCDMTLLELLLHTNTLRTQLQALASICLCKTSAENFGMQEQDEYGGWPAATFESSSAKTIFDFKTFPRGADLLTFLYRRLQEADSVHVELLQYLFSCACQPYLVFVHSWLYHATVKDPYKEFIVDEAVAMAGSASQVPRKGLSLTHLKEQALVSAPCFLEDVCTPLLRSGQQLQILLKLVETGAADATYNTTTCISNGFRMLESALKGWTEFASENSVFSPILIFNKEKLDEVVEERQRKRHDLMQDFDLLFSSLNLQNGGSEIMEGSNVLKLRQVNAGNGVADHTESEGLIFQNMSRDLQCSIGKGNLKELEEVQDYSNVLMPSEMLAECLSVSGLGEEACEVPEREDETHNYKLDIQRKIERTKTDDPAGIEAEKDQPFTLECNRASKQRKKWIHPLEVVVLHGYPEEELSLVHKVAEDKTDLCHCVPVVSYHEDEAEVDTLCSRISGNDYLDLSISRGVPSLAYNLPALSQASPWSEAELKSGGGCPPLQSLTLARSQCSSGFSFFFSDIRLEELGPDFFGRSYIHKLAQNYRNSSLPQSDSYKNNAINFDAVSQKFWSFEDCICNGSFDMKFLPIFSFTNASSALETLSLENENVASLCTEDKNGVRKESAEGQLYQSNKGKVSSNFLSTSALCNYNPSGSKLDSSVQFPDGTSMEKVEVDVMLEATTKDSWKSQGSTCGGASWQSYLGLKGQEVTQSHAITRTLESSEIPLEVIVDKCIIQEVLSQYQCISHFSVRLLHEVFGLQGHLAALRRYFLMERGDWADTFTTALYHHAWYPTGSQHRQLEVQTLLEAAIQNSSCQDDDYAERLHVSVEMKGGHIQSTTDNLGHIYINKNSLSAFDFITLGYHLEWPISLIITSESFKLYNSLFSFLVRVKLAVHALGDIWRFLKDLLHVPKKGNTQAKQDWTNILMLFRQQIAHFVTTLQGHIESQLLHNVWCKFLQVLHLEGKDLQNLETLHGLYLRDALHACFLSDEMKPVKTCVDDTMQCLLDLSSRLNISGKQQDGKSTLESEKVQSAILEAKNQYESSIQQLHRIAISSHDQLSLSQFWTRLDFNGVLGDICSKTR